MTYKILANDLDGTTIDDNGDISQSNIDAIRRAAQECFLVVPTTGRTLYEIPPILLEEKSIEYFIFSNGCAIYRRGYGIIYKDTFDHSLVDKIVGILSRYDAMIEVYADAHPHADRDKLNEDKYNYYRIDPIYHSVMEETRVGVDDIIAFSQSADVEMLNIFFRSMDEREECMKLLADIDEISITSSMTNNIEVLQSHCNKGTGIRKLAEILGISTDSVIAVGDSPNDITAMEASGLSLAVANACDELKKHTDAVICSNNDNVIPYILDNYVFV